MWTCVQLKKPGWQLHSANRYLQPIDWLCVYWVFVLFLNSALSLVFLICHMIVIVSFGQIVFAIFEDAAKWWSSFKFRVGARLETAQGPKQHFGHSCFCAWFKLSSKSHLLLRTHGLMWNIAITPTINEPASKVDWMLEYFTVMG